MTVGKKIAVGLLVVLIQALAVGLFGLWMMNRTSNGLNVVSSEYLPEIDLATEIERDVLNARIHSSTSSPSRRKARCQRAGKDFKDAQQKLPQLQELVNRSDTFADIRPDVGQLCWDFNSYKPALEHNRGGAEPSESRA